MQKVKLRKDQQQLRPIRDGAFRAEYDGRCASCPSEIAKGDYVGFNSERRVICDDCCANNPQGRNWRTVTNRDPEDDLIIPMNAVMPRGRTAADRCGKCFLIHSSAQLDCE